MKKIVILIPVFNDWESLGKLVNEINEYIKEYLNINFECLVVNDSSTIKKFELNKPKNFSSFKILNMKKNKGHARCNAFGIRYIFKKISFDYLILMDGDGEDRPVEIRSLVNKVLKDPNTSVVAKRVQRSEGILFQLLYQAHKIITYLFTGKKINFGNYSCLTKKDVEKLFSKASLWSSYSGTVKKYLKTAIIENECIARLKSDIFEGPKYLRPLIESISFRFVRCFFTDPEKLLHKLALSERVLISSLIKQL